MDALLSFLILGLGESISKALLKFWLRDNSIAMDISSSLVELIKKITNDALVQHSVEKQIREIGDKVAKSVFPLFQYEGDLSEGDRILVAQRIDAILKGTRIDSELLISNNLQPTNLVSYLEKRNPEAEDGLSQHQSDLMKRVVSEVCQSIIDIASQLPLFSERAFSEILRREENLLQNQETLVTIASNILLEVRNIRKKSDSNDFEADYRRSIIRKLDQVELIGVDVSSTNKRHRLSVAYTTLYAEENVGVNSFSQSNLRNGKTDTGNTSSSSNDKQPIAESENDTSLELNIDSTANIVDIDDILEHNQRIFVRGDAGSGKTTLLKWIAVQAASASFSQTLDRFNGYTPFFIRLRDYVDKELPSPENFIKFIAKSISDNMPDGWAHQKLMSGRAFVLIDGLDEVPSLSREAVRSWLEDLIGTFENTKYMITSRPSAVEEGWMAPQGFIDITLRQMDKKDVFNFIDHWHSAAAESISIYTEKQELFSLAAHLKNIVDETPPIFNLVTTPLLCAMICALHRDRGREIPRDRIELYEACTQMLIERREVESQIDYRDYPKLTYRQKRAFLEDCAYWLITNNWNSVETDRLILRFSNKLKSMENIDKQIAGKNIYKLFLERSGMLHELEVGQIQFAHRTFQEFLASQAILNEDNIGVLLSNATNDQWREIIVLTIGLAGEMKKIRYEIIMGLIKLGDRATTKESKYYIYLLASSCLETSISMPPDLRDKLTKRLKNLKLPQSQEHAKYWASTGDIGIPYLSKGLSKDSRVAQYCAMALVRMSSRLAMEALSSFAKDSRPEVLSELIKGWDYFDRTEYAKMVLSNNPKFAEFMYDVPSFLGLDSLHYIKSVKIKNGTMIEIPNIEKNNFTSLTLVNCSELNNIQNLESQTRLESLILTNCPQINDIEVLAGLPNLNLLDLSYCRNISDISPLKGLKNLVVLSLCGCEQIEDISPLFSLNNLRALNIRGCSGLSSNFDNLPIVNTIKQMPESTQSLECSSSSIVFMMPKDPNAVGILSKRSLDVKSSLPYVSDLVKFAKSCQSLELDFPRQVWKNPIIDGKNKRDASDHSAYSSIKFLLESSYFDHDGYSFGDIMELTEFNEKIRRVFSHYYEDLVTEFNLTENRSIKNVKANQTYIL
jgi:hypothetical protein